MIPKRRKDGASSEESENREGKTGFRFRKKGAEGDQTDDPSIVTSKPNLLKRVSVKGQKTSNLLNWGESHLRKPNPTEG